MNLTTEELRLIAEKWITSGGLATKAKIVGALTEALAPVERERDEWKALAEKYSRIGGDATARITALESSAAKVREGALREAAQAISIAPYYARIIESLITTPASNAMEGCEWEQCEDCANDWETPHPEMRTVTVDPLDRELPDFCSVCGKPVVGKPISQVTK